MKQISDPTPEEITTALMKAGQPEYHETTTTRTYDQDSITHGYGTTFDRNHIVAWTVTTDEGMIYTLITHVAEHTTDRETTTEKTTWLLGGALTPTQVAALTPLLPLGIDLLKAPITRIR